MSIKLAEIAVDEAEIIEAGDCVSVWEPVVRCDICGSILSKDGQTGSALYNPVDRFRGHLIVCNQGGEKSRDCYTIAEQRIMGHGNGGAAWEDILVFAEQLVKNVKAAPELFVRPETKGAEK